MCEGCHQYYQKQKENLKKIVGNLNFSETEKLMGYAKGLYFKNHLEQSPCLGSFEEVLGFSRCWEMKNPHSIIDLITTRQTNGHDLISLKKKEN